MFQQNFNFVVMEERQLRVSEMNGAGSNYQRLAEILNGKMLILKQGEKKYSTLKLKDEELQHSITEEELKLKEVMQILQFLGSSTQLQRSTIGLVLTLSLPIIHSSVCPTMISNLLNQCSQNCIRGSFTVLCLEYSS
jgi:hypothetical protein